MTAKQVLIKLAQPSLRNVGLQRLSENVGRALRLPPKQTIRSEIPPARKLAESAESLPNLQPLTIHLSPKFSGESKPLNRLGEINLYTVKNARLYTDLRNRRLIWNKETSTLLTPISYHYFEDSAPNPRPLRPVRRVKGRSICLWNGGAAENYFHWMHDVIAPMALASDNGVAINFDDYLLPGGSSQFQTETLQQLGIKLKDCLSNLKFNWIDAEEVSFISSTRFGALGCHFSKPAVESLRALWIPESKQSGERLIYITRRDAKNRKVENEEEILSVLEPLGFEAMGLAGMSVAEQASLFQSCKVVVAPHGAALANLAFASPHCHIIELFPPNWVTSLYANLARTVGCSYHFVIGEQLGRNQSAYHVPLHRLKPRLRDSLGM